MACSKYLNSIQEQVGGTVGAIRRAELEMHLDTCADCRALLGDLQRIHDAAADLPALGATRSRVAADRGTPPLGRAHPATTLAGSPAVAASDVAWLAIAAALVIATGSSRCCWSVPRGTPARRTPAYRPAPRRAVSPMGAAARGRQRRRGGAGAVREGDRATWRKSPRRTSRRSIPSTAATIEKNLGIIDQAIADNRVAGEVGAGQRRRARDRCSRRCARR
jgi:hypothetical protein